MSININVTLSLPLQMVAAIKNRVPNTNAITILTPALIDNTQAVVQAVDAIPFNIVASTHTHPGSMRERLTIHVKTLTGRTMTLPIFSDTTMNELAKEIEKADGTKPSCQRLISAGQQLDHSYYDDEDEEDVDGSRPLAEYGITDECTIHVVLRLARS